MLRSMKGGGLIAGLSIVLLLVPPPSPNRLPGLQVNPFPQVFPVCVCPPVRLLPSVSPHPVCHHMLFLLGLGRLLCQPLVLACMAQELGLPVLSHRGGPTQGGFLNPHRLKAPVPTLSCVARLLSALHLVRVRRGLTLQICQRVCGGMAGMWFCRNLGRERGRRSFWRGLGS